MLIKLQGADKLKVEQYHTAIEQLGCAQINVDSRRDQLQRVVERLPVLFDYCIATGIRSQNNSKFDSMVAERDLLLSPEQDERPTFSIALDFFWILERLAKLITKDLVTTEAQSVPCEFVEAFQVWQSRFTQLDSLIPVHIKDHSVAQHISLGQKHSVHRLRRLSYLDQDQLQAFKDMDVTNLSFPMNEFLEAYQGVLHAPVLPCMKVELPEEKHQLYAVMEQQFRQTLMSIQDWVRAELPADARYLCWLEDETLHDRIGMTFHHEESTATAEPA